MNAYRIVVSLSLLFLLMAWPAHAQIENGKTAVVDSTAMVITDPNINSSPFVPEIPPFVTPGIMNVNNSGYLWSGRGLGIMASGVYSEHPFLLTSRSASLGLTAHYGGLYVNLNGSVTNYFDMALGSLNQFGVSGLVRYNVTKGFSVTAFGQRYNVNPGFSMAAYPFVNTSGYGAYATFMGERFGIDLGMQKYYDPMQRGWVTAPIVTPKVKISDSVNISMPIGGAIGNASGMMRPDKNPQLMPPMR